jgi:signal transduction histidine kinase
MEFLKRRGGDLGIALAFSALSLTTAFTMQTQTAVAFRNFDLGGYILVTCIALPLIWRTRAPHLVLWAVAVLWAIASGLEYPAETAFFPLIVALYTVGAYLPRREAYLHGGLVGGGVVAWTLVGTLATDSVPMTAVFTIALGVSLPILVGLADRKRRERLTILELSAERRTEVQRIAAADAVRAERARIARELHDVVAHEMTVMTLQAEGARRRANGSDPAIADALETIADSGRKGLAEMQRMIGVLRKSEREAVDEAAELTGKIRERALVGAHDTDAFAPVPSLAAIPALVRQVEEAGLPVRLAITGTSHVPAGVELSAYRIIQESLTNALKYAGSGATATVTVRRKRDAVTVTVEDDGRGVISDVAASSGGHGIAGMGERVASLGGSIDTGARQGGGFRIHAILPVTDDQVVGRRTDTRAGAPTLPLEVDS